LFRGWGKRFFSAARCPVFLWDPSKFIYIGYLNVPVPGSKWLQCEADGLAVSIAKCESEWSKPLLLIYASWLA
jgi:hypothetical protein